MHRVTAFLSLGVGLMTFASNTDAFAQLGSGKGAGHGGGTIGATVTCTVASVDKTAFSFDCANHEGRATYKVNSSTQFALAGGATTFNALKMGASVTIQYHAAGGQFIADSVTAR